MARVFYDLAAQAGEYQDRDGKTRHRFQKMGKLIVEDDGRMWGVLEVLGLETKFSVFPQQDRDGDNRGRSGGGSGRQVSSNPEDRRDNSSGGGRPGGRSDLEDDIPF